MTSRTTTTMPQNQGRGPHIELMRDFTSQPTQIADQPGHAMHISISRGKFSRAFSTQGHNVRLGIWLAGWHIAIYDEFGEQPHRFGAR